MAISLKWRPRTILVASLLLAVLVGLGFLIVQDYLRTKAIRSSAPVTVDRRTASADSPPKPPAETLGAASGVSADTAVGGQQAIAVEDDPSEKATPRSEEQEIIDRLKQETLNDSFTNLARDGSAFVYPSVLVRPNTSNISLPLQPDDNLLEAALIAVLSNRRVSKLLEELALLSKAEAGQLVSRQIREDLETYRMLADIFDTDAIASTQSSTPGDNSGGFGFAIETTLPGDDPNIHYVRLSLLSLAFVAGTLGLSDAADAVQELIDIAILQRDWFYQLEQSGTPQAQAYLNMSLTGLYHPGILTTAMVGTELIEREIAYAVVSPLFYWKEEDLTMWDAAVSLYCALGLGGSPDFSRGRILVQYATRVSDTEFDEILFNVTGR